MNIKMTKEEILKSMQDIKEWCRNSECDDCFMYDLSDRCCSFPRKYPWEWKPPLRTVKTNHYYKHFKGDIYYVISVAKHTETGDKFVIYKKVNDDKVYARPVEMFLSEVDHDKYPDITQKYRFEELKNYEI